MGRSIDARGDIDGGVSVCPILLVLDGGLSSGERCKYTYMTSRKFWVRGIIGVVVILVGWITYVSSKQLERNHRIQQEVSALEIEAAKIRRENETLSEKISYFSSSDFREQEAKQKLGLKKVEETAVVIKLAPAFKAEEGVASMTNRDTSKENQNMPNYEKWWKIFF